MRLAGAVLLVSAVWAQSVSRIPYKCTDEDVLELGLSCTPSEPCAVYLELTTLEAVAGRILVGGNLHTSTTTVSSILLASEDSGKTWVEPHVRMRAAGLEQIQFVDFENGWVSGQTVRGRPRDPFLLVTRDGGKTWTLRPIFEEGRAGSIEQFWFESRTDGSMLIDRGQNSETAARHELYETRTGGDSWSLLQASASPLRMKRARPADPHPDWRLRADSRTKNYHLERRSADRWSVLAQFPIQVGECRPPEPVITEPPPEPAKPEPVKAEPPATPKAPPSLKKKQ